MTPEQKIDEVSNLVRGDKISPETIARARDIMSKWDGINTLESARMWFEELFWRYENDTRNRLAN